MYNHLIPTNQKTDKMASAKITWIIIQCLGWPITLMSVFGKWATFLGIPKEQIFQLSEPYQSVVSVLAIVFLMTTIARSFEKWREAHISNNERAYQIRQRHLKNQIQNDTDESV